MAFVISYSWLQGGLMAKLASIIVDITGKTAGLTAALKSAKTKTDTFKTNALTALNAVKTAAIGFAIASAAAIVGLGELGEDVRRGGGAARQDVHKDGHSVEELSKLKFAAEQSGTSLETVEKATKRMASTILDADNGLTSATDAFDALGLSVGDVQGLNPDKQFSIFADALASVDDASTKAALAQDVFGKSGTELLPLFENGALGLEAMKTQAEELGLVMSTEDAEAAAEFGDALNQLQLQFEALQLALGEKLIPKLTELATLLSDSLPAVEAFFGGIADGFTTVNDAADTSVRKLRESINTIIGLMNKIPTVNIQPIATGDDGYFGPPGQRGASLSNLDKTSPLLGAAVDVADSFIDALPDFVSENILDKLLPFHEGG